MLTLPKECCTLEKTLVYIKTVKELLGGVFFQGNGNKLYLKEVITESNGEITGELNLVNSDGKYVRVNLVEQFNNQKECSSIEDYYTITDSNFHILVGDTWYFIDVYDRALAREILFVTPKIYEPYLADSYGLVKFPEDFDEYGCTVYSIYRVLRSLCASQALFIYDGKVRSYVDSVIYTDNNTSDLGRELVTLTIAGNKYYVNEHSHDNYDKLPTVFDSFDSSHILLRDVQKNLDS